MAHIEHDGSTWYREDFVEKLEARIEAALALHKHQEHAGLPEGECAECGFPWEDGYCPSPTVKALRGEK